MKYLILSICCITWISSCASSGFQNIPQDQLYYMPTKKVAYKPVLYTLTSLTINEFNKPYRYSLSKHDVIGVHIWKHPEFDASNPLLSSTNRTAPNLSEYTINEEGNIYFPLLGNVPLENKTIEEAQEFMGFKLAKYLKQPHVNISIIEFKSKKVYILGEVNRPKTLYLNNQPLTLLDAISQAENINSNTSNPKYIYIFRGSLTNPKIYWLDAETPDKLLLAEKIYLSPNDIVFISAAKTMNWNRFINQMLPTLQALWYIGHIT